VALILVAFALVFGVITYRLVDLQVLSSDRLGRMALAQRLDRIPIAAERGSIFDRNGTDLAMSVRMQTVWANPQVVSDPHGYAQQLAPIVHGDAAQIAQRLSRRDKQFVYVARAVDDATAEAVRRLKLPGVDFVPESRRQYPSGSVAAAVLGKVGLDDKGLAGIEYAYDRVLTGRPGEIVLERDRDGRPIPRTVRRDVPARRGTDVVLTLDQFLQYQAERALEQQVAAIQAQGGTAIVVDTRTGDILAMANVVRDADGNVGVPGPTERNRALVDTYEPGSTNKVVTYSAALEAGVVSPGTQFDVPDWIKVADATFKDSEAHPTERWTTRQCLAHSSNVCTIQIARLVGTERLARALDAFGYGTKPGTGFPGESAGIVRKPPQWYGTGLASTAIGYGMSVTPMQVLDAYTTIANGGVTRPPRLVAGTIGAGGERRDAPLREGRRVVSTATAAQMTSMLESVVTEGTGTCAAIAGYTVAGKSGTARKVVGGTYSNRHFYASFVGFAPAEAPRIAAIVVIDDPDYAHRYGGLAAAPVFAEVLQAALRLERVPPPPGGSDQWQAARGAAQETYRDCALGSATAAPAGTGAAGDPTGGAADTTGTVGQASSSSD
jgi:cell division protein FtsI (penicillin-binding protein 3)